jgi:ribose transport system permease protein
MTGAKRTLLPVLERVPLLLLATVFLVFGVLSDRFLDVRNLLNILVQTSSLAIVATGMTFVLLTAGIDLSVGSIMFLSAAIAGKMVLAGTPLPFACAAILLIGVAFGAVNAFLVARLRVLAFVVTLSTFYVGRGLGLYVTETRAMNLPESLVRIGTGNLFRIPVPIWIFAGVLAAAHVTLTRTAFGRQIFAVGNDIESAAKAGIDTRRVVAAVYVISGMAAAIGGLVAVAQLGAVSPTFGNQREFAAVAAAVLGGTSLFGGRGQVFPGTLIGALLIQTVESGLVIVNADPYLYSLITASIIFVAVFLDSARNIYLKKRRRRNIRAASAYKLRARPPRPVFAARAGIASLACLLPPPG